MGASQRSRRSRLPRPVFTDRQRFPCNAPARVGLPVRRTTIPVAPAASSEQPGLLLRAVPPNYPLTDRLQFDILQSGPGWQGQNVFRSIETARVHIVAWRRGRLATRGNLAFIAQTLIALADLPSGCRAWAALPDCNSRDRSRILGADEHLLRGKSYGHEDRPDPACGHERPQTAGEARLFARRHGHRPR